MKIGIGLAVATGTVLAVLIALPLGWIAPLIIPSVLGSDLKYSGSVWHGAIHNLTEFDSVIVRTDIFAILTGKAPLSVSNPMGPIAINSQVGFRTIDSLVVQGPLSHLALQDYRVANIGGDFRLVLEDVAITANCTRASGRFETDILIKNRTLWQGDGPKLSGPVSCEDGALKFDIAGQDAQHDITADIKVYPSGEYRIAARIGTQRTDIHNGLVIAGFEKTETGYNLSEVGRWR